MNDSPLQRDGDTAAGGSWRPEPELAGDLPRRVEAAFGVKVRRLFFAVATLLIPAALVGLGYPSQRRLWALRDHGAPTVGTVVERTGPVSHARSGTSPARLVHEYHIDGTAYRVIERLRPTKWDEFGFLDQVPIRYLPESPEVAQTERELEDEWPFTTTLVGLTLSAALVFLLSGIPWLTAEMRYRRVRRLLRFGRPEVGVVLSPAREGNAGLNRRQVAYALVDANRAETYVARRLDEDQVFAPGGPGAVATVLVDPADGRQCELYLVLRRYYGVVQRG